MITTKQYNKLLAFAYLLICNNEKDFVFYYKFASSNFRKGAGLDAWCLVQDLKTRTAMQKANLTKFKKNHELLLNSKTDFQENFNFIIEERNLKNFELADKTGLSRAYIGQLRAGKFKPSEVTIKKLAAALKCSEKDLLNGVN